MLLIHGDNDRFDDLPDRHDMSKQKMLLSGAALVFLGTVELALGDPVGSGAMELMGVLTLVGSEVTVKS